MQKSSQISYGKPRRTARAAMKIDYPTITEDRKIQKGDHETKDQIANEYEKLYKARPGTPEYGMWTHNRYHENH